MNRAGKEMAKKRAEERKGLSEAECHKLDLAEALIKEIHYEMFPEEYDFMMDSLADASDRSRGKNPMAAEYTAEVDARRKELGTPPLGTNGKPTDNSSWDIAREEALRRLG
jgi:hypothetical protein